MKFFLSIGRWIVGLPWREIVARLPLPMLALAASYGVYAYALLFVPGWVAVVQAAAFELTYIGLAVARVDQHQRRRAAAISVGAVVTSIIYNSLSGYFHTYPVALADLGWLGWAALSVIHGAPLAWVAYLVASLLLHSDAPVAPLGAPEQHHGAPLVSIQQLVVPHLAPAESREARLDDAINAVCYGGASIKETARRFDVPESTLGRRVRAMKEEV